MPVKTTILQKQPVELTSKYIATLTTKKSTNIMPRISGPIESINIKEGDYVNKGDLLVKIESSEQSSAVSASKAGSTQAFQNIQQAQTMLNTLRAQKEAAISDYELNKADFERYKNLYEKDSATKADLDIYKNRLQRAESALDNINEQMETQKFAIEAAKSGYQQTQFSTNQAQSRLEYYNIRAPFAGYISNIPVSLGEYVTPSTIITNITRNNALELQIAVDETLKDQLREGMTVKVIDHKNDQIVDTAKVWFVAPNVHRDSQTILIKAVLDNTKALFNANQVVNAEIIWQEEMRLTVPSESIVRFAGQDFIYTVVKKDNMSVAKQKPVTLGPLVGNNYIVEGGLQTGEEIVTAGIQKLRDGVPVNTQGNMNETK